MTSLSRPAPETVERPTGRTEGNRRFASDILAEALRDLDIPYIALNPGSSFRGLHDSIVNHLGNASPQVLLCLHEEHAVAIAHGYAKVTHRPMAAAVHSNVGLMHATMAIYNAWCDRMPVVVIGATGPVDAAHRRPWIDWIHTSRDQGAIIRDYVKWDDQPASMPSAREAILRGGWLARTAPMGPVYINLDCEMQEAEVTDAPALPDARRFLPDAAPGAPEGVGERIAGLLRQAERPVILMGRVGRDPAAWARRVTLAEACNARVITSRQAGAAFPTDHVLHVASPTGISGQPGLPGRESLAALREADLILSLDWVDLAGVLKAAFEDAVPPTVIQISADHQLHNGWSMEHFGLPVADMLLSCPADTGVEAILPHMSGVADAARTLPPAAPAAIPDMTVETIGLPQLAYALRRACGERDVSLLHVPITWSNAIWPLRHPLDYVGSDGGGGIGAGPGLAVGGALALKGSGRLAVCVTGDGDFIMGLTALWTAVRYRIPLLFIIVNNQSFYNDEVHQQRMAEVRGRPVENKTIGIRMIDPELDLVKLAEGQGAAGLGPVRRTEDLDAVLREAVAIVEQGGVAVVDVRTPAG